MAIILTQVTACRRTNDAQSPAQVAQAVPATPAAANPTVEGSDQASRSVPSASEAVAPLVESEELILLLTPRLKKLNSSAYNLQVPDYATRALFAPRVVVQDVAEESVPQLTASDPARLSSLDGTAWPIVTSPQRVTREELRLIAPLFSNIAYVEEVSFYLVRGEFTDDEHLRFATDIGIHGLFLTESGNWRSAEGHAVVVWERASDLAPNVADHWTIAEWRMVDIVTQDTTRRMFADVLEALIPDRNLLERLRTSQHWIYATRHYYPRIPARLPDGSQADNRFFLISTAQHPGVSVVDIDDNGFDDLYIAERWGDNQLLVNRGDGTFDERAASYGLNVAGRSNGAVFADFDNDGDPDLMLARSLERSQYFVNEEGHFVDRSTDWVDTPLPFEATSVSVIDYNRDGLLDVYFSTYHQEDISRRLDADLGHPEHRIHKTLSAADSAELTRRVRSENQSFINQVGPPNVLLINQGNGRFSLAPENAQVAVWRNTFQASWSDFDNDGDPDLYVANDFAADNFFRNDGPQGFKDITTEIGMTHLGFAMGVGWGDYDNDLRTDLYVSNMYSKAGLRITSRVPGLDPRIADLAQGNYLYRNTPIGMKLVSGLKPPALTVARAGWSWGGQFTDIDNDGFLDIYVSSGYHTVPPEFETEIDL